MRRNAGWGNVDQINLTDFFNRTSPTYYVAHCLFEHIDCRSLWRRTTTVMGVCIEFDPEQAVRQYTESVDATLVKDMAFELGDDQLRTVAILIGLNATDFTYGWNGYINGLTLYYSHYTDTVPEEIHSLVSHFGLDENNLLSQ